MTDEALEAIWRELRILQIQMAMVKGLILSRTKPERRADVATLLSREFLEEAEAIDREASDDTATDH